MTIVAVAGDVCTTTAVALTSAWPSERDVILVEADPSGGDLAAWLDMPVAPSLSTIVTRALDGAWPDIERHVRTAAAGIRVVPAPDRAGEAARAIGESARFVVTTFATRTSPVVIADTGRLHPAPAAHSFVAAAQVTVLVHRQSVQSSRRLRCGCSVSPSRLTRWRTCRRLWSWPWSEAHRSIWARSGRSCTTRWAARDWSVSRRMISQPPSSVAGPACRRAASAAFHYCGLLENLRPSSIGCCAQMPNRRGAARDERARTDTGRR